MILAIDQGTTGTTCLIIDSDGRVRGCGYREFTRYFPWQGRVERDAAERETHLTGWRRAVGATRSWATAEES